MDKRKINKANDPKYILNPKTKRYVLREGKIGKQIVDKVTDLENSLANLEISSNSEKNYIDIDPRARDPQRVDLTCLSQKGYVIRNKLNCAAYNCTYLLCKDNKCDFVLKIGDVNEKEIEIQDYASDFSVSPKIIEVIKCKAVNLFEKEYEREKYSILGIVMEKMDITLEDLLKIRWQNQPATLGSLNSKEETLLMNLLITQYNIRLYHGDLHLNNIMAKLNNGVVESFKFIDFGSSKIAESKRRVKEDWNTLIRNLERRKTFIRNLERKKYLDKLINKIKDLLDKT